MQVIQQPDALNHSSTLPDYILETENDVEIQLKNGDEVIIEEKYSPNAVDRIKIRLRDLIDDLLFATIPPFDSLAFEQPNLTASYTIGVNDILGYKFRITNNYSVTAQAGVTFIGGGFSFITLAPFEVREVDASYARGLGSGVTVEVLETIYGFTEYDFSVVKGYLQRQPFNLDYFLKSNWLTTQPRTKIVKIQDPEWLNCYTPVATTVKVKAYFKDDTNQIITLAELLASKYYSVKVSPGSIASNFAKDLMAYEVWTETNGIQDRYKQAYWITDEYYAFNDVFLFENRFGGIDTIRFDGRSQRKDGLVVESGLFDEATFDYFIDPDLTTEKNTGHFISEEHRNQALDFLRSKQKYHLVGGKPVRISVSNSQFDSSPTELNSYTFSFKYSEVKDNIPQLGSTLNNLTIQ